jgi:hypothetical protein
MAKLGMFLIRVVIWASAQIERAGRGRVGDLRAAAGRIALACVSFIGRMIDALPSTHSVSLGARQVPTLKSL